MNDQEQIAAIDALATLIAEKQGVNAEQEDIRHATIGILSTMNDKGILEGYNICCYILQKHWIDANPQEALICENAAQAMREALETERLSHE